MAHRLTKLANSNDNNAPSNSLKIVCTFLTRHFEKKYNEHLKFYYISFQYKFFVQVMFW